MKGAKDGQQRQDLRSAGLAAAIPCICTDEMAADVIDWLSEQALLLLQAGSAADVQARMAKIHAFWETLSAQGRMDLLSVPVAAAKQQAAEVAAKQEAAVLTSLQDTRKFSYDSKKGDAAQLCFQALGKTLLQLQS